MMTTTLTGSLGIKMQKQHDAVKRIMRAGSFLKANGPAEVHGDSVDFSWMDVDRNNHSATIGKDGRMQVHLIHTPMGTVRYERGVYINTEPISALV